MTQIIEGHKTEFAIDPAILNLLPEQGSIELQHDAAGKVHRFHTHPVDEILVIISGRLNFMWDGGQRIVGAGDTILVMPQVEMGQGVYTAIAMILAEELDADLAQVALEHAPPSDKLYGNPAFGIQATGNSNSIRAWWQGLREAGAAARAMLVQAAAKQWQVDPASCTASKSEVTHKNSGRKLSYGALASAASASVSARSIEARSVHGPNPLAPSDRA